MKQRSSKEAWKKIEKYYNEPHKNWFVYDDKICFIVRDPEDSYQKLHVAIYLKSGKEVVLSTMGFSYSLKKDNGGYAPWERINTLGNYIFEIHDDMAGTWIRNSRDFEIVYQHTWGTYTEKE